LRNLNSLSQQILQTAAKCGLGEKEAREWEWEWEGDWEQGMGGRSQPFNYNITLQTLITCVAVSLVYSV